MGRFDARAAVLEIITAAAPDPAPRRAILLSLPPGSARKNLTRTLEALVAKRQITDRPNGYTLPPPRTLAIGDRVVQASVDDSRGAPPNRHEHAGTVVGFGRDRVKVRFDGYEYGEKRAHHAVGYECLKAEVVS